MKSLHSYSAAEILTKRRSLRRQLLGGGALQDIRIAVLSGSTPDELLNLLELSLLSHGFHPSFYSSGYGRYYEEAVVDAQPLIDFKPHIVYVHTSYRNIRNIPALGCAESEYLRHVELELKYYCDIWDALERNLGCYIIQNNFELPPYAPLGNMDAVATGGLSRFVTQLNADFARESNRRPLLLLQDMLRLSSRLGLRHWFDWERYFSYKILLTVQANWEVALSLDGIVRSVYGKVRKVLVVDLDDTLWGGVIGDDGVDNIQIGVETPIAEAYTAFQEYCLSLRKRGILLAVCSKNEEGIAKTGFEHPSSVLRLEDISCFKANWEPKHENLLSIAKDLNVAVDSLVFIDDNPAERAIVEAQIPGIAVPDIGSDVTRFAEIIERGRYFEPISLSNEDIGRAALYAQNAARGKIQAEFVNYGEYLDSLDMKAEIGEFQPVYLDRIAQLTNKTNQFNLTTRRYTLPELTLVCGDERYITLYGRLRDRFGDNGLISVMLGRKESDELHLDLWLMSCRVFAREMEHAMLDALVKRARRAGIKTVYGYYIPTKKNGIVAELYSRLGFLPASTSSVQAETGSTWRLDLASYERKNNHIQVEECPIDEMDR